MKTTNPWKYWYHRSKQLFYTYYYAMTDKKTPSHYKILPIMVMILYFSFPIDLIPDVIPFIGYVDDILILPIGFGLVYKMLPDNIREQSRLKADTALEQGLIIHRWVFTIILLPPLIVTSTVIVIGVYFLT